MDIDILNELDELKREHRELLKRLRELDRSLNGLSIASTDAATVVGALQGLCRLLKNEILVHCAREKESLLPVLLDRGLGRHTVVQELQNEDVLLQREYERLQRALAGVKATGTRRALETLVSTGERVISMIVEHIHQEEAEIFPLLEREGKNLRR
ncbi:MAG: hypothetical protein D6723_18245 [Acidobacteria bacterium]|nr:MAG: hypothetical protein D6723_18245 [Acidobacteriota bacterium]